MSPEPKSHLLYENLDTTFVNLWALLRNLSQRGFIGRVHVEMPDYAADVFIDGSATPLVHEIDRAAGTDTLEQGALHRLVLRVRETPGTISVFEGAHEAAPAGGGEPKQPAPKATAIMAEPEEDTAGVSFNELPDDRATNDQPNDEVTALRMPPVEDEVARLEATANSDDKAQTNFVAVPSLPPSSVSEEAPINQSEWDAIVKSGGELIGAVERAVTIAGADFNALFSAARLALADDYVFLDPTSSGFAYTNSTVTLRDQMPVNTYVAGLCEVLRRVVDRFATGDRARRLRERVALELLSVVRKREEIFTRSGFRSQLDRIAGTKVL